MIEKKEYIDRGALIEKLKEKITTNYLNLYDEDALESVIRFAERQPAAAVEPVVRGEWKIDYGTCGFPIYDKCSICNKSSANGKTMFCPHCGAKMQNGAHMERSGSGEKEHS